MSFLCPIMLVFVALTPLVALWWAFLSIRREKRLDKLVAPQLRGRLMPRNAGRNSLQTWFVVIGLLLAFFAAARPRWGVDESEMPQSFRNVVIAVDVSRSMNTKDVRPNRLERAKADIIDLIDSLEGDRLAIVAFRREGTILSPLTSDKAFLRQTVEKIDNESDARGETNLGGAIRKSLIAIGLDPDGEKRESERVGSYAAIILVSDGGDLRGEAERYAKKAAEFGVMVFTIGIGDSENETVLLDENDREVVFEGKAVKTKLEEESLKKIAEISGGRYIRLGTNGTGETTLGDIYQDFLKNVARLQKQLKSRQAVERFQYFLFPAILSLLLGLSLSVGRYKKRSSK